MNRLAPKSFGTAITKHLLYPCLTKLKLITYRISKDLCLSKLNQLHIEKDFGIRKLLHKKTESKDKVTAITNDSVNSKAWL